MTRVRWALSGAVLLAAFIVLGLLVARRPLPLDVDVANALRGQDTEPAGRIAGVLTNILGPVLPYVMGAVLLVLAALKRSLLLYLKLAVVLVLCRLTSLVFKPIFLRQRPRAYPELSYPSGHVVAVASTGLVAVLLCIALARRVRWVAAGAVVATILAAACRLVLGVHWVTDTVGSVLAVTGVGLLAAAGLDLLPGRGERSLDE